MVAPYIDLEDLIDPFITKINEEIAVLGIADEIDEGETVYKGSGTKVMIIPGPHTIKSAGMQTLEVRLNLFVILITSSKTKTLKDMRDLGYQVYNKLMEDVTHDGTCWVCLPRLFHPGFLQYAQQSFVGVQMVWEARFLQTYVPPS